MVKKLQSAWKIGSFCIITYIASYVTRNILSVSTPQMITEAFFTKEYTGFLSSVCFIFYAAGQLINGFIGDMVHPKYMIIAGLGFSSLSTFAIPLFENRALHFAAFAVIGFGLSMLRGPLMKIISENTAPSHARMICTLFCMAGFAGPLIASLLSIFLKWRAVFAVSGSFTVAIAVYSAVIISRLEKNGEIKFTPQKTHGIKDMLSVFRLENFVFYMFISSLSEIASSSITFWIPTYTAERLGFSEEAASTIYSIISFSVLFAPFITLALYEKVIRDGIKISLIMYSLATALFIGVRFVSSPIINISLFLAAKVSASCAAGTVWNAYIPSLAKSGKVSSANGVIDAAGYAMASLANVLFSGFVDKLGWNGIVDMWYIIMALGAAASLSSLQRAGKRSLHNSRNGR